MRLMMKTDRDARVSRTILSAQSRCAQPIDLPHLRDNLRTPMITVTDNAVRQLRSLLESQSESTGKGLRVQIAKGGCSGLQYEMSLDARKQGDAIVERDG